MAPRRPAEPDEVIDAPPPASAPAESALRAHVAETRAQSLELESDLSMDASLADDDVAPAPGIAHDANDRPPTEEEIEAIRRRRRPMGEYRQKLALPARRGYYRHWFNDSPGRVEEARAAGWSFIQGTDGQRLRRVVDKAKEGGGLYAFAMEIPEIFWLEDMAARHRTAKERMDALKQNPFASAAGQKTAQPDDDQKFYSPTGSPIEIKGQH